VKYVVFIISIFCFCTTIAQTNVRLESWNGGSCDENMDPYAIQTRISSVHKSGNELQLTINFRDNCCAKFKPGIKYSGDTLYISTYVWEQGEPRVVQRCGCDCCFSLNLTINGMKDTASVTIFKTERVYYSSEPYRIYPVTYALLKNDTINRTNHYRRKVGLWITYHPDSTQQTETLYPFISEPQGISDEEEFVYRKAWNANGQLISYIRNDTMELWFDNGSLHLLQVKRIDKGDHVTESIQYYPNGKLKERTSERWLSDQHLTYDSCGAFTPVQYELYETYYESGARKKTITGDTVWQWYPEGPLQFIGYSNTTINFYRSGKIEFKDYDWYTFHTGNFPCLSNSLRVTYHENGQLKNVLFVRDEPEKGGVLIGVRYEWSWDESGKLLKSPEHWKGAIPLKPGFQ
jgi:antitoxin component YwqK of YwqJK toxin-antitoxin module